jgi:hypothetical protein
MAVTIDELVNIHRKMDVALAELQSKMDEIDEQRVAVRTTILEMMKEQKLESVRTDNGTVTKSIKERYWTGDWSALHAYIIETGAVDLLEKRIQQTNMREWIAAHPNDHPPSLNIDREYAISIRKPTKAKEL